MRADSRYRFCTVHKDDAERIFLGARPTFRFRELTDTIRHTVSEGETLHSLARFYWATVPDSEHLFWAIADFQPDPIRDVTVPLAAGRVIHVPSLRVLETQILIGQRLDEELVDA